MDNLLIFNFSFYKKNSLIFQALYTQGCGLLDSDDTENEVIEEDSMAEACVVCQTNAVSCALLPCRHLCICGYCCDKLRQCPVCRAHISAYFYTRQDNWSETRTNGTSSNQNDEQSQTSWWTSTFISPITNLFVDE